MVRKVGEFDYDISPYRFEIQHRHVFLMHVDAPTPTRWNSGESDAADGRRVERFECFWIPLTQAHVLQAGQGTLLGRLCD